MAATDWVGREFGDVRVTGRIPANSVEGIPRSLYVCLCSCGKEFTTSGCNFRTGTPNSCGCKNKVKTHGMEGSKIYNVWSSMKTRCLNTRHRSYKWYGAKGITIDARWMKFSNFFSDMAEGYEEGLTLERVDNNGGYCKDNCRWATRKEQARNKSSCTFVEVLGERVNLSTLAESYGVDYQLLVDRYTRWGWSIEDSIIKPKRKFKGEKDGTTCTI